MKKTLHTIFFFLLFSFACFSQEFQVTSPDGVYWGLLDNRTQKWRVKPIYSQARDLVTYNGHYYFICAGHGSLWGVLNEEGKTVIDFMYQDIERGSNGFFCVKSLGYWGVVDEYGHTILQCKYMSIFIDQEKVKTTTWAGETDYISMGDLIKARQYWEKKDAEKAERREREKREREYREKKEKELSSFIEFARAFVEPQINEWQKKGEFEKMADYQKRVTGPNRSLMIDSLTRQAELTFIKENADLHPEREKMKLNVYDSENEVFSIESPKLGKMIISVPIAEAPDFKAHFSSLEKKNAQFYISEDKIALASLDFYDKETDKKFTYSNKNALRYNHYNIDPDKYQFELVNVVTANPAEAGTSSSSNKPQRPIVSILLPETNTAYSDPVVTVRYQATVFDGSVPTIHIWVNGMETEASPKTKPKNKGVTPAWEEVDLVLPKDNERLCNVMLAITDGSGYSSENKTVSLKYVGEVPKPKLHIFSVGVSNYSSPSLSKLGYAAKDAQDFVSTISASDLSMYDRLVTPVILTNRDATKLNIEKGLASLVKDVDQDDVVMLFFSGHGVMDGDDTYFMSVDATGDDPYTGVDFSLIRKNMTKMKDKKCKVLIFMDACYSGAMFSTKSNLKSITFAESDIVGFYSSTASQTSAEFSSDENGVFTKALLSGLKGNAKNKEGEITTFGLGKYVSDFVSKQTRGKQSPIFENKVGDFVLYKTK